MISHGASNFTKKKRVHISSGSAIKLFAHQKPHQPIKRHCSNLMLFLQLNLVLIINMSDKKLQTCCCKKLLEINCNTFIVTPLYSVIPITAHPNAKIIIFYHYHNVHHNAQLKSTLQPAQTSYVRDPIMWKYELHIITCCKPLTLIKYTWKEYIHALVMCNRIDSACKSEPHPASGAVHCLSQ